MFTKLMKAGGVAGLLLLTASLPANANGTTQKANNTTSTGRELTGPQTQPEEYDAANPGRTDKTPPGTPVAPATSQKAPATSTKPNNTTSTGRELTGPGAHPEEYDAANPGRTDKLPQATKATPATSVTPQKAPGTKPNNTTSTGRELTGPGAQPEEYKAAGGSSKVGTYDTVHNVRIRKDTPHPESAKGRTR